MGKFFDLNGDGERSFSETMLDIGLVGALLDAARREDMAWAEEQEALEQEEQQRAETTAHLEDLRAELKKLQARLDRLEEDEPLFDTPGYGHWEQRHDRLQDQFWDLEAEIEETEAQLEW